MSKLNITQRRFILRSLHREVCEAKNAALHKELSKYKDLVDPNEIQIVIANKWRNNKATEEHYFTLKSPFQSDMCGAKALTLKSKLANMDVSKEWLYKEFQAGNHVVTATMEECYTWPKVALTFPNMEKEIKRLRKAYTKSFNRDYDKVHEIVDQAKADCMELNKWLRDVVIPKIMLSSDGEAMLAELISSIPE